MDKDRFIKYYKYEKDKLVECDKTEAKYEYDATKHKDISPKFLVLQEDGLHDIRSDNHAES